MWLYAWQATKSARGFLLHWTGSKWQDIDRAGRLGTSDGLVADGRGGVWAGALAHWTGRRWVNTEPAILHRRRCVRAARAGPGAGRSTLWAGGDVSRTPASPVWDSVIARYP